MSVELITDHVAQAIDRLPQQFKQKVNIEALLTALVTPVQTLENALYALLTERDVNSAIGQQLDDIGAIVGEARQGRLDDDYRRFVRARISTNKSKGTAADVLTVARLIIDDEDATLHLQWSGTASVVLAIEDVVSDPDVMDILISFLRNVVAAGVRIIVEYATVVEASMFFWDTTSWDGGLKWSDAVD